MKIEVLYYDGRSSWQAGLENLNAALQAEGWECLDRRYCLL
jgi:hypothetical protein